MWKKKVCSLFADFEYKFMCIRVSYRRKCIPSHRKNHSKCLVHCKMGVSRSASTVIAYAMKEYGWSLERAYTFVKQKRSITRPNPAFMRQLAEYEGILDARYNSNLLIRA